MGKIRSIQGPAAQGARGYIPELDGLRAFAVVAVVLFHSSADHRFSGGFLGVDLFFVLSSFLITGLLADRPSLASFYWRRFTRLTPALLLMLAAYLAAAPLLWPAYPHGRDALLTALYISDYSFTFWRLPSYLQHSWSLAAEEQFYLIWPLFLALLSRARAPLVWLGSTWLVVTAWRFGFADFADYYYRLDTHSTGLILGSALFIALPLLRFRPWQAYLSGVTLILCMASGQFQFARGVIPIAEVASAALIGCAVTGQLGALTPALSHPALVTLGKWSYGIYLWHYPIAVAVREHLAFPEAASVILAVSIVMAALSFNTVERWGRMLRDANRMRPEALA